MQTLEYEFSPNDQVYIITTCGDRNLPTVLSARIINLIAEVNSISTTINYNVATSLSNSASVSVGDVYATKEEALVAFGALVD